jgi:methylmalonyl-CoA mutase C-terminal domain/subunit
MTPNNEPKIRVVIGKVGLDTHNRGIIVLTQILKEAGMEVIYLGRCRTAESVVRAAIEEDASVIALSDHCGVMIEIAADVKAAAKEFNAQDIPIIAGGFIPENDIPALEAMGVSGIFGAGTPHEVIVDHVRKVATSGRC